MISTYVVSYEFWWEAQFEIDVEKAAPACKESLDFFGDPVERADGSDEEYVRAFLKMWSRTIIEESIRNNLAGVLRQMATTEGCIPLDGSQGIKLTACASWRWEEDDFVIDKKQSDKQKA